MAFMIWSVVAVVFLIIGWNCWKAKEEVSFFTGVKPPKMREVVAYNHAVAKIWFVFAGVFEIIGVPLLFIPQNSPIAILMAAAVVFLIIAIIIIYTRVETKYRI